MFRLLKLLLVGLVAISPQIVAAQSIDDPTKEYLRRFTIEAPFTAIVEYVDSSYSKVEGQRVFKSNKPFAPAGAATISLQGVKLNLYGLSPCPSDASIEAYIYSGKCSAALPTYLRTELNLSPVIICRVFMKYANEPVQDATCWNLFSMGDVGVVHNTEGALLETGAGFLTRDKDGNVLRPDLVQYENYARQKRTLIWSDNAKAAMGIKQ